MGIDILIKNSFQEVLQAELKNLFNEIQALREDNQKLNKKLSKVLSKANPEEVLTVAEVALIMKVKETTVRTWCKNDLIEYQKSGNNYRIKRSAVENYKNKGQF